MWKIIVNIIVLVLLLFFGYHYFASNNSQDTNSENTPKIEEQSMDMMDNSSAEKPDTEKFDATLESSRLK